MNFNRESLLAALKEAQVGLTKKDVLEQSSSFLFADGKLMTFNDEVFYQADSPLPALSAAVPAEDFLKILGRFPDTDLEVEERKGELIIKGQKRTAGLSISKDALLPVSEVPKAGKFTLLPDGMPRLLRQAAETCGRDFSEPLSTVVHVTPTHVEACDNHRFFRATVDTNLTDSVCIPASSIDAVCSLALTKYSLGKGWIHFRTKTSARLAVRCSHEKYHDGLEKLLARKGGHTVKLPANLGEILERAEIMTDVGFDARITIKIEDGELSLTARKETGWYRERKKVKYDGPSLAFDVHPRFMAEAVQRNHKVTVGDTWLRLEMDNVQFMVSLWAKNDGEVDGK